MLKEEILDWIKSQPKGKIFTSYDVYVDVDSVESNAQSSNVLRGLYNDGTLHRKEVTEGNKKRFTYWLKEDKKENPLIFDDSDKVKSPRILTDMVAAKTKQIEIPNNFTLELRTPNGFVITIKSSDIK